MAFYLPQLVQQLRADPGGLVEAFLLDGAAKSQLFAHHLICTLRVRARRPMDARKQSNVRAAVTGDGLPRGQASEPVLEPRLVGWAARLDTAQRREDRPAHRLRLGCFVAQLASIQG